MCFHRLIIDRSAHPWGVTMMSREHFSIARSSRSGSGRLVQTSGVVTVLVFAAVAGIPDLACADEGGSGFWQPGTYDSLAAVPNQPGWAFTATCNHASTKVLAQFSSRGAWRLSTKCRITKSRRKGRQSLVAWSPRERYRQDGRRSRFQIGVRRQTQRNQHPVESARGLVKPTQLERSGRPSAS
jgi:hypothetical protein